MTQSGPYDVALAACGRYEDHFKKFCLNDRDMRRNTMIKLLGPGNDLYTEDGTITKTGYFVMAVSSAFGLFCFLLGRSVYGKRKLGKTLSTKTRVAEERK